jgi:phosphotransferase system enzyme I (PtsI)/phosphotransferase system enzyme I (PtsP)
LDQGLALLKDEQAVTKDGFRVKLLANTGLLADVTPGLRNGAEGVGLYRSEIPFMVRENLPTEEEQLEVYAEVLQSYGDKPVCMRLLDIGGDKPLPYFSIHEDNPYLGWRGIRFTLDNTSIMIIQLRAMIRASLGRSNLRLLIPMVSRIDEVVEVRQLIEQVVEELCAEGYPAQVPLLGIMVEVPSAMLLIPQLADIVDFVSIGTNDLTQYLLAVDRNNPRVSKLFDNLHPAVLLAMKLIRVHCRQAELSVSVCGEMASDPAAVLVLLALGYDRLSLNAHNIPRIKWLIRAVNRQDLMPLLESIKPLKNEQDIRALLDAKLHQLGWYRSVYHAFNG